MVDTALVSSNHLANLKVEQIELSPMSTEDAKGVLRWRYDPPFDWYNPPAESIEAIANLLNPRWQFHSVKVDSTLLAYASFGADGRVPGGDYREAAVDIGLGVAPQFTGQGLGSPIVTAIVRFALRNQKSSMARLTVARFNQRAISLYTRLGFKHEQEFVHEQMPYWVMVRRQFENDEQDLSRSVASP
jgi:RimJ/RimL family protein N-acetyltransferase